MTKFYNQELISNYPNWTWINPKLNGNKPILCSKSEMHQTEAEGQKLVSGILSGKRRNANRHNAKRHNAKRHNAKRHNANRHNAKRDNTKKGITQTDITEREGGVGRGMGWGKGEGLVIAAQGKTKLAPAGTRSADSDFRAYFEVNMAANRAGSASQQTVQTLLN